MNRYRVNSLSIIVLACSLAMPAAADDGGVLIDQSRALAGGITPGDAPGFPITISRPGRYTLTGNLDVPLGQDGFIITTDDVSLDFNGFALNGGTRFSPPSQYGSYGISTVSRRPAKMRWSIFNGSIQYFQNRAIIAGDEAIVEDMSVSRTAGVQLGDSSRVSRSTFGSNLDDGIRCGEACLIERNIVAGNEGAGVFLRSGTVLANTITFNKAAGIRVSHDGVVGYGTNTMARNRPAGKPKPPVSGAEFVGELRPNHCDPACED